MENSVWVSPEKEKPDADMSVLMRLADGDFPVWCGFWDGAVWRNDDGGEVRPGDVVGWMHLENAAIILDGLKIGGPYE